MNRAPWALAAVLLAAPAAAATVLSSTVEQLTRSAELVVRGTVEGQESRLSRNGRRIFTTVRIRTADAWKGSAGAFVEIEVPGGQVGDLHQRVAGAATFVDGEEVVLFLKRAGAVHGVVGLSQGKFRVEGDTARHPVGGLYKVDRPVPAGERIAEEMPLAELERRVRSAK